MDFFTLFGAPVTLNGARKGDQTLRVQLTPELAEHFGREQLQLYFHGSEPQEGQELVAHGSRTFDRMLGYLERRSAFTVQRLPRHVGGGELLMQAIQPRNASIHDLHIQEQARWLFAFTWRITYRADDKRQELFTVLLNQDGERLPLAGDPGAPPTALQLAALLADGEVVPLERNEAGEILPPRLLPLTQLTRLAESARRYTVYHADLRCVSHEAEILPRLHKALNRLTTYYQQQIEEIYDTHDPEGERRHALEDDLARKLAEEVENHRLRVQVDLVSYVALETPAAVMELTLTDGKRQAPVRAVLDRYSGALRRPACHACGEEMTAISLDRNGHLTCDKCAQLCSSCQEIVCASCGVEPCPVCGQSNCAACGVTCWACGGRACADHSSRCPRCGDVVCHACQSECSHCGVRQCRSHLYADCVAGKDGAVDLICAECAVRCPNCSQFTAQTGLCSASGQRFCRNCLATCAGCGQLFGPGYYQVSPVDRRAYCQSCARECPSCGKIGPVAAHCAACGREGCPACMARCSVCHEPFCAKHRVWIETCNHVVCAAHVGQCAIGREPVCLACNAPCAICARPYCGEHTRTCVQCGQEYCSECVRGSGLCDTCAHVTKHGEPAMIQGAPWAAKGDVAKLVPYYTWRQASNDRYTIYFGEGAMMTGAVIVVTQTEAGEQVIHKRRIGAVERLRGMLGR